MSNWKEELYNLLVEHSVAGLTIGKALSHERVEDFISKTLKASQQQLLERLSEKVNELGSRCGTGCRREECRVRNSTVEKVKALIQEELKSITLN